MFICQVLFKKIFFKTINNPLKYTLLQDKCQQYFNCQMPTILQMVAINGRIVRRKILILRRKYGKLHYISH